MPRDPRLVAILLPPGVAVAEAVERAWDRGDAVAPLDPHAPASEIARRLELLRPGAIVDGTGETGLGGAEPVPPGVAAVLTTSGSTAEPKLVVLAHPALEASAAASISRLGLDPSDRWLCCLPTHHIGGFGILVRARVIGNTPVIHPGFDVAEVAAESEATVVSLVPTMLARLVDMGADLARWKRILVGGGPVPADVVTAASEAGANVVRSYGMTETSGGLVYDGVPLDGAEVRIERERIYLRGPMLMHSYRGRPDLTEAAFVGGWLRTEDGGRWTDRGTLEVLGRLDDVILTGGENVSAEHVASALEEHPDVERATVFGVTDREWGERVVAAVVPVPGRRPSESDLKEFVAARRGRRFAPKEVRVIE